MRQIKQKNLETYQKIEAEHKESSQKAKVDVWKKKTGMSIVSYYNYKNLAEKQNSTKKDITASPTYSKKRPLIAMLFILIMLIGIFVAGMWFGILGLIYSTILLMIATIGGYNLAKIQTKA
jgi:hypothetical protein